MSGTTKQKLGLYVDFSGGRRTNGEASKVGSNETPNGVNGISTPAGALTLIPGSKKIMDESAGHATKKITMLANYKKSDGTSEVLVAYDGWVRRLNMGTGVTTSLPTSISTHNQSKEYGFVNDNDKFYFCNGIDDMQVYDGTTNGPITLTNVSSSTFKTDTFAVFGRKMFAVDYSNKILLHRSRTDDITDFSYSGGDVVENAGTSKVAEGSTPITSLEVNQNLYVFTKNNIYNPSYNAVGASTVFQLDNIGRGVGAINNTSTITNGDAVLFFDAVDKNITQAGYKSTYPTIQINGISEAIRNMLQDTYDLTDARGIYWKRKYLLACKSSSSQPTNDIVLIVDLDYRSIYVRTGWYVNCWMEYNGDLYYGSAIGPFVYKAWDGYDDDGAMIPLYWDLKRDDFGNPAVYKNATMLYVEGTIDEQQKLNVQISFDYGRDSITKQIDGSNTDYIINNGGIGELGTDELGRTIRGGSDGESERVFQVWIRLNAKKFQNAQITFTNDGMPGRVSIRRVDFPDLKTDTIKPPANRIL